MEYARELQVDLCFQGFAEELRDLPGNYRPPSGALLLAYEEEHAIACVAMRPIAPTVAEMKRLYVQPAYRGMGWGRKLAQIIVARAHQSGYAEMVLDTLAHMHGAQALYRSLGFEPAPAYYNNPLPDVLYFRKRL